jgi:hypothetical protein
MSFMVIPGAALASGVLEACAMVVSGLGILPRIRGLLIREGGHVTMIRTRNLVLLLAVVLAALSLSLGSSPVAAQDDGTPISTPGQVGPGGDEDDEDDPDARATEEAEEAEATEAVSVDVLPSTGSGSSGGSILSYLVILGGAALVALAAIGSMRHRSQR